MGTTPIRCSTPGFQGGERKATLREGSRSFDFFTLYHEVAFLAASFPCWARGFMAKTQKRISHCSSGGHRKIRPGQCGPALHWRRLLFGHGDPGSAKAPMVSASVIFFLLWAWQELHARVTDHVRQAIIVFHSTPVYVNYTPSFRTWKGWAGWRGKTVFADKYNFLFHNIICATYCNHETRNLWKAMMAAFDVMPHVLVYKPASPASPPCQVVTPVVVWPPHHHPPPSTGHGHLLEAI